MSTDQESSKPPLAPDDLAAEIALGIEIDCQYVVHLDSARAGVPSPTCAVPDQVTVADNARLRGRALMLADLLVEREAFEDS